MKRTDFHGLPQHMYTPIVAPQYTHAHTCMSAHTQTHARTHNQYNAIKTRSLQTSPSPSGEQRHPWHHDENRRNIVCKCCFYLGEMYIECSLFSEPRVVQHARVSWTGVLLSILCPSDDLRSEEKFMVKGNYPQWRIQTTLPYTNHGKLIQNKFCVYISCIYFSQKTKEKEFSVWL